MMSVLAITAFGKGRSAAAAVLVERRRQGLVERN